VRKDDFGDVLVAAARATSAVVAVGVLLLVDAALVAICSAAIETFSVGGEAAEAAGSDVAAIAENSWTGVQGPAGITAGGRSTLEA
jgi:hypothetical protein